MANGIIPIKQMWSNARLIFFTDTSGEIHDCTGDIVWNGRFLVLDNRADKKRLAILRKSIILEETL
ncbi:hypothetical protein ES707_07375 [subsurface metagenome]